MQHDNSRQPPTIKTTVHNPLLTYTDRIINVHGARAKSRVRIITPEYTRRTTAIMSGFFVADFQHVQFMTGLMGPISIGPVSLYAGGDNPISPVTNQNYHSGWQALNTRSRPSWRNIV